MARAAFLMDRAMAGVGLSRPQLHSAAFQLRLRGARHHGDAKHCRPQGPADHDPDRPLDDLLGAPPVYTVIIAAFVPNQQVLPGVGLQGLVLLGLDGFGVIGAMGAALLLRRTVTKGQASGFIMEMPEVPATPR